jgi:hypothetical protein
MIESLIALFGVFVGAFLSLGWDVLKQRRAVIHAHEALRGELDLNLEMLPHKRSIAEFALQQLKTGELSPLKTMWFSTTFYDRHLDTVYGELSAIEVKSLHFIREHIRTIDGTMEALQDQFKEDLKHRSAPEMIQMYINLVTGLIGIFGRLEKLLKNHLNGTPME